jgi:hypothetical protein
MPYKTSYPPVRVSPIAKERLDKIVKALKKTGQKVSGASFLTNLILTQPIPSNGHAAAEPVNPCEEEK